MSLPDGTQGSCPDRGGQRESNRSGQTWHGLLLASLVLAAWLALQTYAQFHHRWNLAGWLIAPMLVALLCWLNVGLFIVAHDALHRSLAPALPRVNRAVGWLCLVLYAGFQLRRFEPGHHRHHRHPGSAEDPDFQPPGANGRFWPWYASFMRHYLGWPEVAGVAIGTALVAALSTWSHAVVFWAVPALLASLQLFTFGTWLPHRPGEKGFADHHHARSSDCGTLASLLRCFHFGYHHEHHLRPDLPWWRLPAFRRSSLLRAAGATANPGAAPAPRHLPRERGSPAP